MRKILFSTVLITLLIQNFYSQTSENSKNAAVIKIREMNSQVVKLFREKEYDEALRIASEISAFAKAEGVADDERVLPAVSNLADIYAVKGKENEAVAIYNQVLAAYEKKEQTASVKKQTEILLIKVSNEYIKKKNLKDAEIQYKKLAAVRENIYGEKSKQSADAYYGLAQISRERGNYDDAETALLKVIEINDLVLNEEEKESREDISTYQCFVYHRAFRQNKLSEVEKNLEPFYEKRGRTKENNLLQGIINGKALDLVKPRYPQKAKDMRADGFTLVGVEINESGDVIRAKATCGVKEFAEETEKAAMKSKFSPTLKNGIPVKVTGIIVYKFDAR